MLWRWEQTPLEAWVGFKFWVPPPNASLLREEVSPFKVEPQPLEVGSDAPDWARKLSFQFAVSDCASTKDIQETRAAQPYLPVTGAGHDRRSGVLVLDENRRAKKLNPIVAGYVIEGALYFQSYRIFVRPEYRKLKPVGLGALMVLEWYKRVMRPEVVSPQKMNPWGVRTFLAAQHAVYDWAVRSGKTVPDKVLREMETRTETNRILEVLAEVERTGEAMVLT